MVQNPHSKVVVTQQPVKLAKIISTHHENFRIHVLCLIKFKNKLIFLNEISSDNQALYSLKHSPRKRFNEPHKN
jgi:hypothetical protein